MYLTYQRFGWLTQLKINLQLFRIEKQLFNYEKRKILNVMFCTKKLALAKPPNHQNMILQRFNWALKLGRNIQCCIKEC